LGDNDVDCAVEGGGAVDNADEVEVGGQPMSLVEGVLGVGPLSLMVGQGGNSYEQENCRFFEHPRRVFQYIVLEAFRTAE